MKIYFTSNRLKAVKTHNLIINWLKKKKHQVENALIDKTSQKIKIKNFDVIILEIAKSDKAVIGLIFEVLMQSKPVLLLYEYHSRRPKNIRLPLEKKMLKHLTIKGYVPSQLPQVLEIFFSGLERGRLERFNLFITRDINEYLNWIPYGTAKTKSDFVRSLVREKMKKDKKYGVYKSNTKRI